MNVSTIFFYLGATASFLYFNKYINYPIIKNTIIKNNKFEKNPKIFISKETQTDICSFINDPSLNKSCQISDTIFIENNIENDIEIINHHPYKYSWFTSILFRFNTFL